MKSDAAPPLSRFDGRSSDETAESSNQKLNEWVELTKDLMEWLETADRAEIAPIFPELVSTVSHVSQSWLGLMDQYEALLVQIEDGPDEELADQMRTDLERWRQGSGDRGRSGGQGAAEERKDRS